jgi:cephalosporin hydroxylase
MTLTALAQRARRRLKHSSLSFDRADERVMSLAFKANRVRREELAQRLLDCDTPERVLDLAGQSLGSTQKASEILGLVELARQHEPAVYCEVGTLSGGTHFTVGRLIESLQHTVAVDIVLRNRAQLELLRPGERPAHYVEGSSYAPETVRRVAAALGGRPIDLLFIDGDHSYTGVKADFLAYRQFVRPGGLIAFHDICDDHATKYGRDTGSYAGDVPRFWRTLRRSFEHYEFIDAPDQDGFGIGVLVHSVDTPLPAGL